MKNLDLNTCKTNNSNSIKHSGTVSKISKDTVTVSLKENINCASCNAKSACGISGSNSKEIEVFTTGQSFSINEPVNITLQMETGLKAVFWAYFFPFSLMLIVLIIGSAFFKEWIVGLLSIFILIPYFLMLYLSKDSFKKAFKISILKH